MRRILFTVAIGVVWTVSAAAQQPGEIVVAPHTFAAEYQALTNKDAYTRNNLLQLYKNLFEFDLMNVQDRDRFGKEYAVFRAFKDSFGSYRLNVMANSRLSVRPGTPAGGSVTGYVQRSQLTLDLAGKKDTLLSDERKLVYLFLTEPDGSVREPNKNPMEMSLDPRKSQSVTWSGVTQLGYGLYDGRPATGKREDAQVWLPDRGDVFTNVKPEDFSKKIRWLAPAKSYNLRITLDNQGNWTWLDESMGIDLKGKIAN